MVFCRNLLPIVVLLVAVNSRFGLALPHQSIRLDPSDVPFIYNLNASWTETCPGGETDCAPGETCCPLKNQGYGCCPYKDAVCCSDQLSCCPGGTQCNIIERICDPTNKDDAVTTAKELKEAKPIHNLDCPDPELELCPEDQTCCVDKYDRMGCCPYKNAICCPGGQCCPSGMKCNLDKVQCEYKNFSDKVFTYPLASPRIINNDCTDPQYKCTNGTCCKTFDGKFGCCPHEGAHCCADGKHCCPPDQKCDIEGGRCIKANLDLIAPVHIELTPIEDAIRSQIRKNPDKSGLCPDHKMQCPDGTTCCKLYDGSYGCCPYSQGVCCKDGAHCCPHATQCDIQHGRCIRSHFLPMLMGLPEFNDIDPPMEKVSMLSSTLSGGGGGMTTADSVEAVEAEEAGYGGTHSCPNPEDQCLDGQTCCQISEKDYGCCPFVDAVCCKDMAHCCPHNTSCDLESDTCVPKPANNVTTDTTTITPLEEDLFLFDLSIIN